MSLPPLGDFVGRLPESLRALRNPLTFFGLFTFLVVVCICVAIVVPGGLPTELRALILIALLLLLAVPVLIVSYLAVTPGERWAGPADRLMSIGNQYGTDQRPLPRNEILRLPSVEPSPSLLPEGTDDAAGSEPTERGSPEDTPQDE